MSKPNIQLDDEIREMTDEEYANYETLLANPDPFPSSK